MWIIRLHKLESKDYNYIKRVFEKIGFSPRKTATIVFVKALFLHLLQKKSWRNIATELNCSYLSIFSFYSIYRENIELKNIFKYFARRRIIVFVGKVKYFSNEDLEQSEEFFKLTIRELKSIFS
ncbi:hypothetical protein D8B46_05495 [Candidatus Gracilibacteria bacterium]|nr:MAG: hypothetical protein D8B46_05495 [Candidatus Gracilibacteria bacterium]